MRVVVLASAVLVGAVGVSVSRDEPRAEALAPYYDPATTSGSIYRLYRAYFLREPDPSGYAYWRGKHAAGTTLSKISESFARSSEFVNRYGSLSNGAFLTLVYDNVLDRKPDSGGYTYWLGRMNKGLPRGSVMLSFSDSSEYRRVTALGVPPGFRVGSSAQAMLAALTVAAEPTRTGYDRDLFPHWDDENSNGCDTRCEVLRSERSSSGTWFSLWEGYVTDDTSELEIDHVVALAEAWDSGANTWTASQRDRFADWQVNLTAVTSATNQFKSDKDASEWFPTRSQSNCAFAEITVTTKFRWNLSVDPAEKSALGNMLNGCTSTSSNPPTTTTTKPPICKTAGVYVAKNGVCVANYEDGSGDVDCGQLPAAMKPVQLTNPNVDPYALDGSDHDGIGCES